MKLSGNTILITGGGSGIGREMARCWHDMNNTVIVAGRNEASLQGTADGYDNIHTAALDIADASDIDRFAGEVVARFLQINVLVNNAGIMRYEAIDAKRDLANAEATILTNLLGPIRLIDAMVDHLSDQKDAVIANVSSGLAFVPMPAAATYSATKAAIHSYTISLRERLKGKVEVVEIIPPAVQTELTPGQSARAGYMPLNEFIEETMAQFKQENTPAEIVTEKARLLRNAEAEGRFDMVFAALAAQ